MFSKFILSISIIVILFVHFTILTNQKSPEKKQVITQTPTVSKISVKKVLIKKKEIKKLEQKKIVKQKAIPKEIKKVVKNAKRKVLKKKVAKKEIIKQAKKIEKEIVKEVTQKVLPTITKKIEKKIVSKKEIISVAEKNMIKNRYLSKLRAKIQKNKIYPKKAKRLKQEGKVLVSFLILKNGNIKNVSLKDASKFKRLNAAALELLEKIAKFEPIPKELEKNSWIIEIPINYSIINT